MNILIYVNFKRTEFHWTIFFFFISKIKCNIFIETIIVMKMNNLDAVDIV